MVFDVDSQAIQYTLRFPYELEWYTNQLTSSFVINAVTTSRSIVYTVYVCTCHYIYIVSSVVVLFVLSGYCNRFVGQTTWQDCIG